MAYDDAGQEEIDAVPPAPRSRWRQYGVPILIALGVTAVGVLFAAIKGNSTAAPAAPVTPPLVAARDTCDPGGTGMSLGDGNKTLVIDSKGREDFTGVDIAALACALRELSATTAVIQHMDSTRALDGRQTDEWPGYRAAWTYHPDAGLDLVIQAD